MIIELWIATDEKGLLINYARFLGTLSQLLAEAGIDDVVKIQHVNVAIPFTPIPELEPPRLRNNG